MRQPPRPDTPRLMVQVFGSPDKVAGPEASEALREEMIDSYPSRVLWVMSKEDVLGILEQSGYPTNEQLSRSDEAALAKTLRADEYVRGNVTHDGEVYHVKAQLVLTRDATLTQPLPEVTNRDASDAGEKLADHVDDARKQLEYEKKCLDHARNRGRDLDREPRTRELGLDPHLVRRRVDEHARAVVSGRVEVGAAGAKARVRGHTHRVDQAA